MQRSYSGGMTKRLSALILALALCAPLTPAAQTKRALALDDHSKIVSVGDPQRSPDGLWVAYTVSTIDAEKDRRNTDIWMVKWDGSEQLQLTSSPDGESSPRWSPDGKYLAFVASRGTEEEKKKGGQIWLLNRAGGEAQKVSDIKGGVSDIQWSPDSTRIAYVADNQDIANRSPYPSPSHLVCHQIIYCQITFDKNQFLVIIITFIGVICLIPVFDFLLQPEAEEQENPLSLICPVS